MAIHRKYMDTVMARMVNAVIIYATPADLREMADFLEEAQKDTVAGMGIPRVEFKSDNGVAVEIRFWQGGTDGKQD